MTNYEVGDVIIKDITLSNKNTKAQINPSDQIKSIDISNNVKGNTLPGIIAFLYYSGSLLFLFVAIAILCFFASTVEFISFMISKKYMFFSSINISTSLNIWGKNIWCHSCVFLSIS